MTITTLQQTLANAWRTYASRIVAVILSLALLVVGVFAYRSASVPASIGRAANQRSASAPPTAVVPAARRSGSASAGQGSQTTYRAVLPDELDYLRVLSDEQVWRYIDARPDRFQAYGFTRGPVLPDELDYLRVLSDEQVRRYIDARPDRFQAYGFTRGPVLPGELDYLRVLSDEQVRRYIDARQGTPRP